METTIGINPITENQWKRTWKMKWKLGYIGALDALKCELLCLLDSRRLLQDSCHAENVHKNEFVRNRGIDGTCSSAECQGYDI